MGKKYIIILLHFIFLFSLNALVHSATITWINNSPDNFASNPANWSGGMIPQDKDKVVFNAASTNDCSWDVTVTLSSFMIEPGYTGIVTINADLTIDNGFTWTGNGSDDLASNPANWAEGVVPRDGDDVYFSGTDDCLWDINITPASLSLDPGFTGTVTLYTGLSIAGNLSVKGGVLNLNNKALSIDGDLLIDVNGTIYATSSTITVKGDWINRGAFNAGTSTVILNVTNQTIYGNTTFYNLVKTVTIADTLYFEAGKTQTILNNLTLQGANGNLLSLRSTVDGSFWYINPQGARSVSIVDIKDAYNTNPVIIIITDFVDSGNNQNVHFGNDCVWLNDVLILAIVLRDDWRLPC